MKEHRTSTLSRAIAGCFTAGACTAHAVYLSPDGTGQALIYPYYTVQSANGNAFNTYLSVVNTTTKSKAVKVRFLEGRNARKALDFNLYLSPNDVWTAAMGPQDATDQSPAILVTADKSCTSPPIPSGGVAFRNFYYVGANVDGGPTSLDRTREGYFEIIEMATLTGEAAAGATHNTAGLPANCAFLQPESGFRAGLNAPYLRPPNGGLMGTYTLINVANGLNFAGNATALGALFAAPSFADADSLVPNLASADPVASTTAPNSPGLVGYRATYANGRDAVSATLMKRFIFNEFALELATHSASDFVMTFPTKSFYVAPTGGTTSAPFTSTVRPTGAGACEPFVWRSWARDQPPPSGTAIIGAPAPPLPQACWAAGVLSIEPYASTFHPSSVLGSLNSILIPTGVVSGWGEASFTEGVEGRSLVAAPQSGFAIDMAASRSVANVTVVHEGLPVIGFAVRTLNNGLLSCSTFGGSTGTCVGSYGMLTDHRYSIKTSPTP